MTELGRPVPVPDETSVQYWRSAAEHVLSIPRCSACGAFALPPEIACFHCGTTAPDWQFTPVSGRAVIRSWTVMRQSFLPGFDTPYVLVDAELDEQPGLRMIGRLLDGVDAPLSVGAALEVGFEDIAEGVSIPAFSLVA